MEEHCLPKLFFISELSLQLQPRFNVTRIFIDLFPKRSMGNIILLFMSLLNIWFQLNIWSTDKSVRNLVR